MPHDLRFGDCLDVLRTLPDCSVDAVVTDPPYGLAFMGKRWDYDVPSEDVWRECLRVLKPGGHLLAFAGTRTQHRMAVRIEDAGFEIRDMIAWVYGSGFPKSLDVSKALEAYAKTGRSDSQVTGDGRSRVPGQHFKEFRRGNAPKAEFNPETDAARQWQGWGTALKPALEPITMARKPLAGTVAANVLEHGTGGLNVDGCRVASSDQIAAVTGKATLCGTRDGYDRPWKHDPAALAARQERANAAIEKANTLGRWPANLIHDGSEDGTVPLGDAARFFYCAKASKRDRDEGCDGLEAIHRANGNKWTDQDYRVANGERPPSAESGPRRNHHPTVKPTDLMRYLCRLVTPPGGVVLDPFMGSGSTGKAANLEGFRFIGVERDRDYMLIAEARVGAKSDMPDWLR